MLPAPGDTTGVSGVLRLIQFLWAVFEKNAKNQKSAKKRQIYPFLGRYAPFGACRHRKKTNLSQQKYFEINFESQNEYKCTSLERALNKMTQLFLLEL